MTTPHTEPKTYQCRHLFADGHRCGSPALRAQPFCFYHQTTHRPAPTNFPHAAPPTPHEAVFHLPFPEDRPSIQLAIGEVLRRIAQNQLDPRRAGLLLYGLQIASANLPKPLPLSKSRLRDEQDKLDDREIPDQIIEDPHHGPLAPEAPYTPYEPPLSIAGQLLREFHCEDDEDEPTTLPKIQACQGTGTQGTGTQATGAPGQTAPPSDLGSHDPKTQKLTPFVRHTLHHPRGWGMP